MTEKITTDFIIKYDKTKASSSVDFCHSDSGFSKFRITYEDGNKVGEIREYNVISPDYLGGLSPHNVYKMITVEELVLMASMRLDQALRYECKTSETNKVGEIVDKLGDAYEALVALNKEKKNDQATD